MRRAAARRILYAGGRLAGGRMGPPLRGLADRRNGASERPRPTTGFLRSGRVRAPAPTAFYISQGLDTGRPDERFLPFRNPPSSAPFGGTCPYPLCRCATSPLDKGSRPPCRGKACGRPGVPPLRRGWKPSSHFVGAGHWPARRRGKSLSPLSRCARHLPLIRGVVLPYGSQEILPGLGRGGPWASRRGACKPRKHPHPPPSGAPSPLEGEGFRAADSLPYKIWKRSGLFVGADDLGGPRAAAWGRPCKGDRSLLGRPQGSPLRRI